MKFQASSLPYIDVNIEGSYYPLIVDLGSRLEIVVFSNVLEILDKHPYGTEKWKNFRGTAFEYPAYALPKLKIGSQTFKKPILTEFPIERNEEHTIWESAKQEHLSSETVGYLGRGLLRKTNLLLDMKHSKMILTSSVKKLKSSGYNLTTFKKIPFELSPKGMTVLVDTDLGKMKFLLDTGCTWTLMHEFLYPKSMEKKIGRYEFPVFLSSQFVMNGTDFGSQEFHFINMTEELNDIDGFLGMDFIKKHVMYIDFSKKILYIQVNSCPTL